MVQTWYLVLFMVVLLACSHDGQAKGSGGVSAAKRRAEKMIRQLNLFPASDLNRGPVRSMEAGPDQPGLVENRFELDLIGDPGPGVSVRDLGHHAGYFRLPNTVDARMFYLFFESRGKKSDPVVIWLTGGPGCSSELALFYENGPFYIAQNLSLIWNNYGWDKVSNIIYVDQPIGTGFSYSSSEEDIRHDEIGVSNDLYAFLQEFFKAHPEYAKNDFYITGESYAGHYIPALASRINKANKDKKGIFINLKGLAIGNGLTNPEIQYPAYPDFAFDNKLITKSFRDELTQYTPDCQQACRDCDKNGGDSCNLASSNCQPLFENIISEIGNTNYYDIRKKCDIGSSLCYNFSNAETLLNTKSVKDALGVGDIDFVSCSTEVYDEMVLDWFKNLQDGIPALLKDGLKLLIYAGEYDFMCNWIGNWRWVHAMEWFGKREFGRAPNVTFLVDRQQKGLQKSYGPLTFLKVYDAGHLVPMDQPKASLEMIRRWMHGLLSK